MDQKVTEALHHIPDFFICDHLRRPDVRRRMAAAFEAWTLREQGMTVKEIASLLGMHQSTVRDRIANWHVYALWAKQDGKCAKRIAELIGAMLIDLARP